MKGRSSGQAKMAASGFSSRTIPALLQYEIGVGKRTVSARPDLSFKSALQASLPTIYSERFEAVGGENAEPEAVAWSGSS